MRDDCGGAATELDASRALDLGKREKAQDGGRGWQVSRQLYRGQGSAGGLKGTGSS